MRVEVVEIVRKLGWMGGGIYREMVIGFEGENLNSKYCFILEIQNIAIMFFI